MAKACKLAGLALLVLAAWTATADAQVVVRAPFVDVDVFGPNVSVRAPFFSMDLRGVGVGMPYPPPTVYYGPVYGPYYSPAPVVTPLPAPRVVGKVEANPVDDRPATIAEFVRNFKPTAGTYKAVVMHPHTQKAVSVEFTLPEGCRKIRSDDNQIEFDCGDREVEIRFLSTGAVKVQYND